MSEKRASGLFLVLDGGEGSGKSTQLPLLTERLRAAGRDVVATFGGFAAETPLCLH